MEVELICSENLKRVFEEILINRKIKISESSNVCIIEKGFDLKTGKIGIYFDIQTINILINYLDEISGSKEEVKNIITGRCEEDELKIISYDEIYYFEAMGNDVFCITKNKRYKVKEKLYELEERLEGKGFIRVINVSL